MLCDDPALFKKISLLAREFGRPAPATARFLRTKLAVLADTLADIGAINSVYRKGLSGVRGLTLPKPGLNAHEFPVFTVKKAGLEADLAALNIPLERTYTPFHLLTGAGGKYPASEFYARRALHLPAYPMMTELQPDTIGFNHLEYISLKDHGKTAGLFKKLLGEEPAFRPSEALVKGIDPLKLSREVDLIKNSGGPPVKFYPDLDRKGIRAWYDPARSFKKPGFCAGQWDALWLSPYGDLLTCQPLAHKLGPASAANCLALYNGETCAAFRRALARLGGFFPACARCGREPYQARR